MANHNIIWANTSLRADIFNIIDAYAFIPIGLWLFHASWDFLKIVLIIIAFFGLLAHFGFTFGACVIYIKSRFGRWLCDGKRSTGKPVYTKILGRRSL